MKPPLLPLPAANRRRVPRSRRAGAFILMEVVIAVAIFALAGVGLAVAINDMGEVFNESRQEAEVRRRLETLLTEARLRGVAPGKSALEPDAMGVVYETETAVLPLENKDRMVLTGLYRITVKALWKRGTEEREEAAEIYVYQP